MNTKSLNKKISEDRNFWLVLLGKTVSQLGDGIFSIAMPWYILSITDSAVSMSVYLVLQNIACVIGLIVFGRKIDTWKKEKAMYIADYVRGIYLLFLYSSLILNIPNKLVYVYIGAIILNLCMSVFNPSSMSLIPLILKKEKLAKGNSILSVVDNSISIIGLTVGVTIYELLGIKQIFFLSGLFYLLSGFSEMFIKPLYKNKAHTQVNIGLISGLKYLYSNKKVLFIIIFALSWNFIYITMHSIYLPFLFNKVYNETISSLGTIQIVEGVGLIIGAAVAMRIRMHSNFYKSLTKIVIFQLPIFVGYTIILILNTYLFQSFNFVVVLFTVLFFLLGLTVAIVNVNVNIIIQSETDLNYIGRVNSIKSLGSMMSMAFGLLIGGILLESISVLLAFMINSVLFIFLTVFMVKKYWLLK